MRDRRRRFVLSAMPGCFALQLPFALWLSASPGPGPAAPQGLLPGGNSPAFHERMMAWSAPAQRPVTLSPPQSRVPAALPHLSSAFGWRLHPIRGTYRLHSGIDIPGRTGTPVLASARGRVRFAGPAGGYGNMIEIDHGNGLETRYAHLSRLLVAPGAPVVPGETIGLMGSTGLSTGSHLHFEVRDRGRATNPLAWLGRDATSRPPAPRASPPRAREDGTAGEGWTVGEDGSEAHISQFARSRSAAPGRAGDGS